METIINDLQDTAFWESSWEQARRDSFLMNTQKISPERWHEFYDSIGDIYHHTWGEPWRLGEEAGRIFFSEGLIRPGSEVLDLGCGPGTLSIPLAEKGVRVTGMDYSENMLTSLQKEAAHRGLENIRTVRASFGEYQTDLRYDLVAAACFPPVLEPSGIKKIEEWSKGFCAVIFGSGEKDQPIRKSLWSPIMKAAPPSGKFYLIHLMGWLLAGGRQPNLKHISWTYRFSRPFEEVLRFYKNYFAIFGKDDAETELLIRNILEQYRTDEHISSQGEAELWLVWWKKP
jgi:SAM-dependent methyltransferase